MSFKALTALILILLCAITQPQLSAEYAVKGGGLVDADLIATAAVEEHFSRGVAAINQEQWEEAAKQFRIITANFPNTTYGIDSHYYLGIAEFKMADTEFANNEFSEYLKLQRHPKFFEETITYKYQIANRFKDGARRHLFGFKTMPMWASGDKLALQTYDEVIHALPCHDIAAWALFRKGDLLWDEGEYRDAIECYQSIVKKFPKHELAPESYVIITRIYIEQCKYEFQNPDLLALAQINLRRFKQDFPRAEGLVEAEQNVEMIQEIYAKGLYDTGQFYERTNKPMASILYYKNAIKEFPETHIAELCKERLNALNES